MKPWGSGPRRVPVYLRRKNFAAQFLKAFQLREGYRAVIRLRANGSLGAGFTPKSVVQAVV